MKIELNEREYDLIRNCLEKAYYLAKDEGNDEEMDFITEFEEKLIKLTR